MQVWALLTLLGAGCAGLRATHVATDAYEYKRQLAWVNSNLYLGSDASVSAISALNLNSTLSISVLSPFSATTPVKVRRVFPSLRPSEIVVHALVSMYHPMAYIYFLNIANVSAITVTRVVPVSCVQLSNPILEYTTDGVNEYIVAIDNSAEVYLMKFVGEGIDLLQTIKGLPEEPTFSPYSLSTGGTTIAIADLDNGLVVLQLENDGLVVGQVLGVQGTATSVFLSGDTAWVGTEVGVAEFTRNDQGLFTEIEPLYPMLRKGLFPYYIYGTEDAVGYVLYDTNQTSYVTVFPRLQSTLLASFKAKFDPFVIVNMTLYQCQKGRVVQHALIPQ